MSPIAALEAALRAGTSATAVLEAWCGDRVTALVEARDVMMPDAALCARLAVAATEPIVRRRVRLVGAGAVLARATCTYIPARLSPAMRDALAHSDTPFGVVVAALSPRRDILRTGASDVAPLVVDAVLLLPDGQPLALVHEAYTSELLAFAGARSRLASAS